MTDIKSFYFDTALVAPSGLPSLMGTVPLGQIVFGTDYPYASEKVSKTFDANLDQSMLLVARSGRHDQQGSGKADPPTRIRPSLVIRFGEPLNRSRRLRIKRPHSLQRLLGATLNLAAVSVVHQNGLLRNLIPRQGSRNQPSGRSRRIRSCAHSCGR